MARSSKLLAAGSLSPVLAIGIQDERFFAGTPNDLSEHIGMPINILLFVA